MGCRQYQSLCGLRVLHFVRFPAKNSDGRVRIWEIPESLVNRFHLAKRFLIRRRVAQQDGEAAFLDWTTDPVWPDATITARGALIYNATQGNKAVGVLDFGQDISSFSAPFTVELPAQAIRIA